MGTVYLAQHTETGENVAIKMLGREFNNNEQLKKRFYNEARTLSLLHHQNIIALKEFHEQGDLSMLIMEYVEGRNLEDFLLEYKQGLPLEKLKGIFLQILWGLCYAHSKGIAHRDIKPSNIIVNKEDKVKICDFGISKAIQDCTTNLTATGLRLGTIRYMSPEHIMANKDNPVDFQSDIYSLGITIHQMMTGQMPYSGVNNEFEITRLILEENLPEINLTKPEIPRLYSEIVAKMVAKMKHNRYKNCSEIENHINAYNVEKEIQVQQQTPNIVTEESNESITDSSRKRRWKHIVIWLLSLITASLIIIVIVRMAMDRDRIHEKVENPKGAPKENNQAKPDNISQKPIFIVVEEMPTFQGGDESRVKFLADNIKYPQMAKASGIQGTVLVTFVIDETGRVTDVKVLRGIGGGCDEEAIRVVKMMPPWNPGRQDGQAVCVQFNMPIKYTLN